MRRLTSFLAAMLAASAAHAQSYPSPVFQGLTARGCTGYAFGNGTSPVTCAPTIPGSALATGAAATNVGALSGGLSGSLPSPAISSNYITAAMISAVSTFESINISFVSKWAHAIVQTLLNFLSGYPSATLWGAVGDNSTDNTTAITNMMTDLCAAGYGRAYFPPGSYKLSGTLTISCSNVHVAGGGAGATRLIATGATQTLISLNGTDVHSIEVSGLQLENSNTPPTGGFMIYFANTNVFDVKIHDLTTFRCYVCIGTDIQTPGTTGAISDVSLTNFEFRDTRFGGIQAQSDIGWKISKGVISFTSPQGTQPLANSFAIRLGDWTDGIWLTDLNLLGGDNTLITESVFSSNQRAPAQIFAQNLSLDSGWNTALNIVDTHEFNFNGGSIGNLSGGNAVGAQISAGVGIKFTGTVFANVNKNCVNYSGGTYVTFDAITLASCSRASAGTYHGIYVAPNQSYWAVRNSNGRVDTSWYGSNGQGYSLYIDTGNNHFVATNNILTGVSGGLFNGSSGASASTVSGNVN